jgi:hypothetical protein
MESVRARLERLEVEGGTAVDADEFARRERFFECVLPLVQMVGNVKHHNRALRGIKSKLERLFQQSTPDVKTKNEEDMTVACDLAEDLSAAIVEYQVGTHYNRAPDSWLILFKVFPADGDL